AMPAVRQRDAPPPLYLHAYLQPAYLAPFPTRRSSDLQVSKCLIGLAVMMLQSCDVADNRRDMLCGNWESVEGKPDVLIYKEGERSEEHTSELQSRFDLVCRLLLEEKKAAYQTGHKRRQ